jgi:hypothetical protein
MKFSEYYVLNELTQVALNKAITKFVKSGIEQTDAEQAVKTFNDLTKKNKIKKGIDIFSLSFDELQQHITDASGKVSRKEKSQRIKDKDTEYVYEDDKILIVSPKTHESSCKYGSGTQWCITMTSPSYWNQYYQKGIKMYFIIPKKHTKASKDDEKVAVAVDINDNFEIFNANDQTLSRTSFENWLEEDAESDVEEVLQYLQPLDRGEYLERTQITESEYEDLTERWLEALGIKTKDPYYDTAKKDILQTLNDHYNIELASELENVSLYDYARDDLDRLFYDVDASLEMLENQYGIDSESAKNKVILFPYVFYGDLQYDVKNENEPFDDIYSDRFNWEFIDNLSVEQLLDRLKINLHDKDGLDDGIVKNIELWLTLKYKNKHNEFISFFDDIKEYALEDPNHGGKVSDTVLNQLKQLYDKVEKVEYGKQDHPKLDLQGISFKDYLRI